MASKNELNNTKMLQMLLDGQTELKSEISGKIDSLKKDLKEVKSSLKRLLDSLIYLEEDTPTQKEFIKLQKRVKILETKLASI